jgi:extracellular factor (EF) 3-hydroxypalmitic acid methyl ester biosynthesis protein
MLNPKRFLDELSQELAASPASASIGVAKAIDYLSNLRAHHGPDWTDMVRSTIATHPVMQDIRLCPLTGRCAAKPRGYAGDAVMIDYIYGTGIPVGPLGSPVTQAIYAYATSSPASRAVRYRRYRLADLIDSMATQQLHAGKQGLRVLSVAAGHGREIELSAAFRQGLISEFVALDQDAESLAELKHAYASSVSPVTPLKLSIKQLLAGSHDLGQFDLIYSAGLYDYLDTPLAKRLTARLFELLRPTGRLLYANFAPDIHGVGYMEAAMDWWLTYRDATQTRALGDEIDETQINAIKQYTDPDSNIHFVELQRR